MDGAQGRARLKGHEQQAKARAAGLRTTTLVLAHTSHRRCGAWTSKAVAQGASPTHTLQPVSIHTPRFLEPVAPINRLTAVPTHRAPLGKTPRDENTHGSAAVRQCAWVSNIGSGARGVNNFPPFVACKDTHGLATFLQCELRASLDRGGTTCSPLHLRHAAPGKRKKTPAICQVLQASEHSSVWSEQYC